MPVIDTLQQFEAPYDKLDIAVDMVEGTRNEDKAIRLVNQFILPTPIITAIRLKAFFLNRKNRNLRSFEKSVRYNLPFALSATVTYFLFWSFSFELLHLTWQLFHLKISFEQFFNGAFQWRSIQATLLFFLHRFISKLALDSFHINSTFYSRYDLLKQEEKERGMAGIVELQASNQLKLMLPQMMKDIINQSCTALIANDEISPHKAQQIQQVLMGNMQQFMSQFGLLDNPPVDVNHSLGNQRFNQSYPSHASNQNLLDDDDEYGKDFD